jgi:hypothetical protein
LFQPAKPDSNAASKTAIMTSKIGCHACRRGLFQTGIETVCREHSRHDLADVMDAGREIGVWSWFDPRQRNTYSCDHWMVSMGVK